MKLPYRFGRYTLTEKIADGGTAEVYRAILNADEGFQKTVAVKRLLPAWGFSGELQSMLIDEARALTHLQHQAIVQVFELGRCEGIPFMAMEFVDGIDSARLLTELIRDRTPLPTMHLLYIVGQVLVALEFAHRSIDEHGRPLGIVHRDVSPSNILLSWNGEVKVTDFGIAKGLHRTHKTQVGQLKGKYAYMAPEQARGLPIDARADVFACGIVLYELLTARRLFDARTDLEVIEKVKEAKLPEDVIAPLPPELRAILYLSLAPDPGRRYRNAAEMLADVQRYARASGATGSSLEFAAYLRERFPPERETQRNGIATPSSNDDPKTRGMAEGKADTRGRRAGRAGRSAAIALLLAVTALMPPSSMMRSEAAAEQPAQAGEQKSADVRAPSRPPPMGGAIAIDSRPSGADGTLILGKESRRIKTPFSIDGIDIGDGVEGRVEISAPGYQIAKHSFLIEPSKPAFVKSIDLVRSSPASISISARPWGLVDIPGYASGRETPVSGLKVKAGAYQISVRHPPSGGVATARVSVVDGESKRCLATFGAQASISCR